MRKTRSESSTSLRWNGSDDNERRPEGAGAVPDSNLSMRFMLQCWLSRGQLKGGDESSRAAGACLL